MKRSSILIIFLLILGFTSCKKRENEKVMPKPDGVALENFYKNQRMDNAQNFTIDANNGGTLTGDKGTKITFPPNAFALNGTPVTGNVEITLLEIYDRASMLINNMPTTGVRPNGDEETLQSAGEIFVEAKQGNNILELIEPMHIESAFDPNGDINNLSPIQLFKAEGELDEPGKWQEVDENSDGVNDLAEPMIGHNGPNGAAAVYYAFDTQELGWTNLDRWYNYTGQLTTLYVDVPDGYDETNCEVFVLYEGEPTALARLDVYDTTQQMFTEHFGKLPVGINIHVLMTTMIDGELHYSLKESVTTVPNHIETMPDPQPTTQQDLLAIVQNLP